MIRKALLAACLPLAACAHAQETISHGDGAMSHGDGSGAPDPSIVDEMPRAGGEVINGEGAVIGAITIIEGPHGSMLEVTLEPGSLTPGWHGLHLHQVGDCSDLGVFKKSGGHLGLIVNGHGLLNPLGPEIGDVPNIWAAADGSAGYEAFTPYITIEDLADEDGTAMIIHANRDDHISQPIGGAGPRVACAVIN